MRCKCMTDNKVISEITLLQREVRRLSRLFTSYILRPGPGRPRHRKVTLATKMRSGGESWAEVFGMCLPDRALFESSAAYRNAKLNLKKAVHQRQKRADLELPVIAEV